MKKQLLVVLTLIAILLVASGSAAAKATRTEFTGTLYNCAGTSEPEGMWFTGEGHVMHVRGMPGQGFFASDDLPLFNGTITGVIDLDLNLVTGSGSDRATFIKSPYGVNGTFEGYATTHYTNFVETMTAVGLGTGDLAGVKYFGHYDQIPVPENPDVDCEVVGAYAMTGVLLDTRGE